jgi:hypothetical protein
MANEVSKSALNIVGTFKNLKWWEVTIMTVVILVASGFAAKMGANVNVNISLQEQLITLQNRIDIPVNSSLSGLQKPYDYIISMVDTYYCLQNGTNGKLDYFSTSKVQVENDAFGNLTSVPGTVLLKGVTLDPSVNYGSCTVIEIVNGKMNYYGSNAFWYNNVNITSLMANANWNFTFPAGTTFPTSPTPTLGNTFYLTTNYTAWVCNGTAWASLGTEGATGPQGPAGPSGSNNVILPVSCLVFVNSTSCYAEAANGSILTSGSNQTTVINYALSTALTNGRTWQEKTVLKGNFTTDSIIQVGFNTEVEIQGTITRTPGTNSIMIQAVNVAGQPFGYPANVWIHGGTLDGSTGTAVGIDVHAYDTWRWKITDMEFVNIENYCMALYQGRFSVDTIYAHGGSMYANPYGPYGGLYCGNAYDSDFSNLILDVGGSTQYAVDVNAGASNHFINIFAGGSRAFLVENGAVRTNFVNIHSTDAWYGAFTIGSGCHHITVEGGTIDRASKAGDGTYSYFYNGGTYCIITGITFSDSTGIYRPKYCIEETTGANYNIYATHTFQNFVGAAYLRVGANSKFQANIGGTDYP